MRLVFDCETDGLLDTLTVIHSLVFRELESNTLWSHHEGGLGITEGLQYLMDADEIIGHNIIGFDIPAIQKVYPWFKPKGKITDTLVWSRLIWTDMFERDMRYVYKNPSFPLAMRGRHSLESWGFRLGVLKGDYGKTTDWKVWTPQMQAYCEQDVAVTEQLLALIESKNYSQQAGELEHRFAELMFDQERRGFRVYPERIQKLYAELAGKREDLRRRLQEVFPPTTTTMKTPEYWSDPQLVAGDLELRYPTKGVAPVATQKRLVKGPMKTKVEPFNPGSRLQIADRLTKMFGWKPTTFTPKGSPEVDEDTLSKITHPAARLLSEWFIIEKRIGQIAEGDEAWLRYVKDGRIHGRVNTMGCVTGRCSHSKPNVAQVPREPSPYGRECRECWGPTEGMALVGTDAQGLELRCLAHYMAEFDGGAYAEVVLNGDKKLGTDIHSVNMRAAGLTNRDDAKTMIYALIYGAGDEKLGSIPGVSTADIQRLLVQYSAAARRIKASRQKRGVSVEPHIIAMCLKGAELRAKLYEGLPALKLFIDKVKDQAKAGFLIGLDGRKLHVRSSHAAPNTLLQSAGALVMKQAAIILANTLIPKHGWVNFVDYAFVANIHDEIQAETKPEIAHEFGHEACAAIVLSGEHFKFRCRLDGESKVGANWHETH